MFKLEELARACDGKIIYNNKKTIENISINTNEISTNTMFIPIKGKNYDGHEFIDIALKNNIIACIVSKKCDKYKEIINKLINNNISIILINNLGEDALSNIAYYNRIKNYDTYVIAITGSNGKTSTKDLIYDTLKSKYNVLKTSGNLNNIIGVSKTLLKLNKHDFLIIEMGMNHSGEISKLSKIVKPNLSIITNIGSAHLGNLGSFENIMKSKLEILDGMDNKLLYVNGNNKYLSKLNNKYIKKYKYDYIKYGRRYNYIYYKNKKLKFKKNINPNNVIISYIIGSKFGISKNKFNKILSKFNPPNMRMEIIKHKNYTIINDCYNSNYESCINGIDYTIKNYKNKKIVLILGDILELGKYTKYYHELLGKYINKISNKIDRIILIGDNIGYTYNIIKFNKKKKYNTVYEVDEELNEKNCVYYIKASRGIKLDKLIKK